MTKTMMMAAFALATAGAMPATAQTTMPSTTSGQTGTTGTTGTMDTQDGMQTGRTGTMSGNGMNGMDHGMNASSSPKKTKAQMASWKKCQAMPEAKMMKNKSCMKMSKMQGMNGAM